MIKTKAGRENGEHKGHYWLQSSPEVYKSCTYVGCEISPRLAQQQSERVATSGGHGGQYRVEVRDGADVAAWGTPKGAHCFILGMELLDNCAHDRCGKRP